MKAELGRLARALARLVSSWWCVDRIRARSDQGRLLRLEPPLQWIRGHTVAVKHRTTEQTPFGAAVCYHGCDSGVSHTLIVTPDGSTGAVLVRWREGGEWRALTVADVEVIGG